RGFIFLCFIVQNGGKRWVKFRNFKIIQSETKISFKSDNKNPFPMLRNPTFGIYNPIVDKIAQLVLERPFNNFKCSASIVTCKIFNIFQQKDLWTVIFNYLRQIKKQGSLSVTLKAMLFTKRFFFGNTRYREGLARESGD